MVPLTGRFCIFVGKMGGLGRAGGVVYKVNMRAHPLIQLQVSTFNILICRANKSWDPFQNLNFLRVKLLTKVCAWLIQENAHA